MRKWLLALTLLAICVPAMAGQSYLLKVNTTPTNKAYKLDFGLSGRVALPDKSEEPVSFRAGMTMSQKIVARTKDGAMKVEEAMRDVTVNGMLGKEKLAISLPQAMVTTYDRMANGDIRNVEVEDEKGKTMSVPNEMIEGSFQSISNLSSSSFPPLPLHLGDGWGSTIKLPLMPGMEITIKADNTLVDTRVIDGKTYVVIKSVISATMPRQHIAVPAMRGQSSVDVTSELNLKGQVWTIFDPIAGTVRKVSMDGTMTGMVKGTGPDGKKVDMHANLRFDGSMNQIK